MALKCSRGHRADLTSYWHAKLKPGDRCPMVVMAFDYSGYIKCGCLLKEMSERSQQEE